MNLLPRPDAGVDLPSGESSQWPYYLYLASHEQPRALNALNRRVFSPLGALPPGFHE